MKKTLVGVAVLFFVVMGIGCSKSVTNPTPPTVRTPQIIYTADVTSYEIYSMNADGTNKVNLTNDAGAADTNPAFSYDATKIVYNHEGFIYVMNADGTSKTQVTTTAYSENKPFLSPDKTKVVFASSHSGNYEIYIVNIDGTGLANLSNNAGADTDPVISPDGTKIVFSSTRGALPHGIYVMNIDGSSVTRLTADTTNTQMPSYSNDGTKIVYIDNTTQSDIYSMNANGTGVTRITNDTHSEYFPVLSPDMTKVVYESSEFGDSEICVVNIDGTSRINVSNNSSGDDGKPCWR